MRDSGLGLNWSVVFPKVAMRPTRFTPENSPKDPNPVQVSSRKRTRLSRLIYTHDARISASISHV